VTIKTPTRPVLVVAGARPNFMKVVPILKELDRRSIPRFFVHTGQHYDAQMSDAFLSDLQAPAPAAFLEVGSASHAIQTARIMERFEPVLLRERPSWVVVVGDVNSTLACALVAAKLRQETACRIAHVEAGLRSGDWGMPEEVNRVLTDQLSDLLLTPSEDASKNLEREGLGGRCIRFVGNVMIDSLLTVLPRARELQMPVRLGVSARPYVVVTLHRPSNVDEPARLGILLEALSALAIEAPVIFPMHPRTRQRIAAARLERLLSGVIITDPLGYTELTGLVDSSAAVLTDSGGLQEETTVLGVPCVTLREQTERPITVRQGTNRLATWPPTVEGVIRDVKAAIARDRSPLGAASPEGWDGMAAARIVDAMCAAASPNS
jgi:UDP-N-acetylglucosamine 2-epimerase (non-hydrolysing)